MTDRELLELAAKAAGLDTHWGGGWQADTMFRALPRPNSPLVANVEWNPLTDDGDALRLAVKLGLVVEVGYAARGFVAVRTNTDNWMEFREAWGACPYAATRLAIVRAAAEIGRQATTGDTHD